MAMDVADMNAQQMPDLTNLDPAEHHFLVAMIQRARRLDPWMRGVFAESLVCTHLRGATLAPYTFQEWDIKWAVDGCEVTIAVRTSGARVEGHAEDRPDYRGSFAFKPKLAWDVVSNDFVG